MSSNLGKWHMYMTAEGNICCWYIFYSSMVNKCFSLLIFDGCVQSCGVCMQTVIGEVQWNIYVQCGRHICSGPYASKVECMYTSASGHIVDCSELI